MNGVGKRIIITGGGRGIGASTLRAFVREGAKVVSLEIDPTSGKHEVDVANNQASKGGEAIFVQCDISSSESVDKAFNAAMHYLGGLDVLANIAAIDFSSPAEDWSVEQMQAIWGVNINGTILTNQAACKMFMDEGKGNIINFASDVAMAGMPNGALYAASKGAVLSWTRTIAKEWASKYNIRCNCVNPTMATPMYEAYLASLSAEDLAIFKAKEKQTVPLGGRMGDPDKDMAPVMLFLASDASGFINGQIVPVNGGRIMLHG